MKKSVLIALLITVTFVGFGQAKFEIGLKAGLNQANTNIDGVDASSSFHAGLYSLIKLSKIGIQPEVLYSPQKNESSGVETEKVYIDIPVLVKFYLAAGVNLQAGPQFGLLTSAETAGADVKNIYKNSDVSAAIGAGWDAPFGLQVNARYILGLSDINDLGVGEAVRNRTLQISVGYSLFKLGK